MKPAIRVEDVTKTYRIGASQSERMLRDVIAGGVKRLIGRGGGAPSGETVDALSGVSLDVAPDEVVGVIGRNGSGKTTLLKLLARITWPTSGTIDVRGRVASLVEVGTGFHPELSGRENVYLNGSILGLKRREIAARFDEIVDFSGVEAFLDTPIKRYSTGMRLRLGFAVAAHLFPDVLLVDEVLAVGDAEFQAKCLRTMKSVGERGHTVLFVSHDLEAVESICPRTVWIDRGKLVADGPSREVIARYLSESSVQASSTVDLTEFAYRAGSGEAQFTAVEFLHADGSEARAIRTGDALTLRLRFRANETIRSPYFGVSIATEFGTLVAHPNTWSAGLEVGELSAGEHELELAIKSLPLMPGSYPLTLWMNRQSDDHSIDWLEGCATLAVHTPDPSVIGRTLPRRPGVVHLDAHWKSD